MFLWFGFVSGFVGVPNLRSKDPWQWAGFWKFFFAAVDRSQNCAGVFTGALFFECELIGRFGVREEPGQLEPRASHQWGPERCLCALSSPLRAAKAATETEMSPAPPH